MKNRSQQLQEQAKEERLRCRDWLLPFMAACQPKFLTKAELCSMALQELKISKHTFDFAWIDAIETSGRQDWYEPLRRRQKTAS